MIVRDATSDDMSVVCDIYNALIETTTVAWSETPESLDERISWFQQQRGKRNPVLVADADGEVVGFASYGSFRGAGRWPGYRYTVEYTVHVRREQWGAGIGRQLLSALIDRAREAGLHVMVGAIDADNAASLRFHERLGFSEVARMPEVGRKFDRWLDLVLVQLIIQQ